MFCVFFCPHFPPFRASYSKLIRGVPYLPTQIICLPQQAAEAELGIWRSGGTVSEEDRVRFGATDTDEAVLALLGDGAGGVGPGTGLGAGAAGDAGAGASGTGISEQVGPSCPLGVFYFFFFFPPFIS